MMQNAIWRWSVVAALGCVAFGLWHLGDRTADAQMGAARPTAVAAVDLALVLEQLNERVSSEQELQLEITTRQAAVDSIVQQVQAARDELQILPQNSDDARVKAEEFVKLQAELRAEQEISQAIIDNKKKAFELDFFNKIRDAAARYAQREGFDLVIANDSNRIIDVRLPAQQVQALIGSQRLLFADSSVDITDEVATFMNNEYQVSGPGN